MSHTPQGSANSGTIITAFFDRRHDAETAINRLSAVGVSRDSIHMTSGGSEEEGYGTSSSGEEKGFFESLGDFFFPDEDRHVYAEGLSRGGILVTVRDFPSGFHDTVLDLLDDEGAVDVEDRAESWRSEGWTSSSTGALPDGVRGTTRDSAHTVPSDHLERERGRQGDADIGSDARVGGAWSEESTSSGELEHYGDEGTTPVVKETPRAGKRDMSHGRVRVRSYVYESPVSRKVDLSEEQEDDRYNHEGGDRGRRTR